MKVSDSASPEVIFPTVFPSFVLELIFPLAIPHKRRYPLFIGMEAKDKFIDLVIAEHRQMAEADRQRRSHQSRASAYRDALEAIKDDTSPENTNIAKALKAMIAREDRDEKKADLEFEHYHARKEALEQLLANIARAQAPNGIISALDSLPPPRLPGYDYAHKDLRDGTDIFRVRELLRKVGAPMLLSDIVSELFGREELDPKQGKYASLRGTLMGYANQKRVFTIEAKSPHVIGLLEFNELQGGFKTLVK